MLCLFAAVEFSLDDTLDCAVDVCLALLFGEAETPSFLLDLNSIANIATVVESKDSQESSELSASNC